MYFVLSKTLGIFAVPSTDLAVLAVVGAALLRTRFAQAGRMLLRVGLALLIIVCVLPLGTALTLALEQRFPPWTESGAPPDGMIVLGGVIDPDLSAARGSMVIGDAAERVTEVAQLARRYPTARGSKHGRPSGGRNVLFVRLNLLYIRAPYVDYSSLCSNEAT